jgi:starvation-inducible DNA-binding protein
MVRSDARVATKRQVEVGTMVETVTTRKKFVPALENGVAFRLQHSLIELTDLGLHAKQAHWNVVGPNFRSLHAQFDEIADMARTTTDAVAERLAALEVSPDGTLAAVAESPLEPFPVGWLPGPKAVEAILARLEHMARTNRTRINEIRDIDPVAETILVELAAELDKAAWMLRVQED